MSCKNVCRLCNRFIISDTVTFADNTLTVNIPAGSYASGEKYCIVIAQSIPEATTITAPAVIKIGEGADAYPIVGKNCAPVLAGALRTRTKYSAVVITTATGGSFKLLGRPCCAPNNALASINGGAAATESSEG